MHDSSNALGHLAVGSTLMGGGYPFASVRRVENGYIVHTNRERVTTTLDGMLEMIKAHFEEEPPTLDDSECSQGCR